MTWLLQLPKWHYHVYSQVNYTIKCLKRMIKEKVAAIEPTQEAQDKFVQEIKKDLETTVWKRGGMCV